MAYVFVQPLANLKCFCGSQTLAMQSFQYGVNAS